MEARRAGGRGGPQEPHPGDVARGCDQRPEGRAVLHVALRQPRGAGIGGAEIERVVLEERERMLSFADRVRSGAIVGSSKHAVPADRKHRHRRLRPRARDGGAGAEALRRRRPALRVHLERRRQPAGRRCSRPPIRTRTLFIVASKTFTTLETLTNANSARAWLKGKLGEAAIREHFAAVSVNHKAMDAFGVHPDYRFQMWDWVGGRYSMWSSIGVSLAIAHRARALPRVPARRARDGRSLPQPRLASQPAGADGPAGRVEHQLPPPADARCVAV